ncbi:MAG: LicD family protein [Bacteroidaceae bacterium]|nr:LicD family protein [Bacteroidaceae bacterium]
MISSQPYNYDLRQFQLRSVVLLDVIDKVCKEHGIRYYIIAGTLLGAVRHKGYIPWDDDLDVAFMRSDYDLLLEHASEWFPEPFHIVDCNNDPRYPKYFAKLEDRSTTLVESFHLGYVGGIYVDLFPLDSVPDNKMLRAWHFYRFNLKRRLLYLVYRDPYKHGKGVGSLILCLLQKLVSKEKLHKRTQRVLKEFEGKRNCNYVMTHDDGFRAYRKSVFGTPRLCEFEGHAFCAPEHPEGFLSVLYGDDYMTPPPVEKRRSHMHDYCDLENGYVGVDINELKKQLKV